MNILNRIEKIFVANLKASFRKINLHPSAQSKFSFEETANQRNQQPKAASNQRDKELVLAYAVLEIPYGTSLQAAKIAWKKLLKKYHPDLFSNDTEKSRVAHEVTQGLNDAFHKIQEAFNKTK